MKISKLLAAAVLCSAPIFASTYFGGAEDMKNGNDHDYNDLVFSLSGSSLKLVTTDGKWYSQPALGTSGTPFWTTDRMMARRLPSVTPTTSDTAFTVGALAMRARR